MTKQFSNYSDLLTFTRASKGHALRPVSYGDELVENGTFDSTPTGWLPANSTLASVAEELVVTNSVASQYGFCYQGVPTAVGKLYLFTIDITATSSNAIIRIGDDASGNLNKKEDVNRVGPDSIRSLFVATASTTYIRLGNYVNTLNATSNFDNVSLKEVLFDQPDGTLTLFEHPNNVPRVEYDADGNRLGLLVEESRTNLITDSAGASSDDATSGSSQTSGQTNSLTGLDDAFLVQATNTGTSYRGQRISVTSGTSYAASRFIKAGTTNFAQISMGTDGFGTNVYANFDLSNGTVATESNCDASITEMGGGWYRCSITKTATNTTSGTSPNYFTPVASGASTIRTATSGDNVYQFGAQTEVGSFPTSYIKTQGSTVSRAADVASIPVADFGYNQSEGTVVVEAKTFSNAEANHGDFALTDSGTSPDLSSGSRTGSSVAGSYSTWYKTAGTTQANLVRTSAVEDNVFYKAGFCYKANDFAQSVDGGSILSDSSGTVPSRNSVVLIGDNYYGKLNGHIKSIKYFPRRLTNAQLVDLTS